MVEGVKLLIWEARWLSTLPRGVRPGRLNGDDA